MNLLDLLFPIPESCSLCARKADMFGICKLCLGNLAHISDPICQQCGRSQESNTLCTDCCQRKEIYFICNRSAVQYNAKMKEVISLYKFRGLETLSESLVSLMEQVYQRYYAKRSFDAITFVPLHEKRLHERGFNQAQQLAILLGLRLRIPVYALLKRVQYTEKQSKKHRHERLMVLAGHFQYTGGDRSNLKRILLVDDVYTTGTTINECAKVLVRAGMEVYSLTLAR